MTGVDAHPVSEEVHQMSRLIRSCAPLAVCALLLVPAAAQADAPVAKAAKKCSLKLSEQRNLGATYVVSLSVSDISCSSGKSVVKSYHECRRRNGKGGKCGGFSGWSCSERRYNKSRLSYDATATCTKGSKKVVQQYQQNL